MRPATLALLLTAVLLAPAATAVQSETTLSGRVTTADGTPADATVLVERVTANYLAEASAGHDVPESLRKLANAAPEGLSAFETSDGRYRGSLDVGTYRVVAVAGGRVSRVHAVRLAGASTQNLTVADAHLPRVNATDASAARGANATVAFRVYNPDDTVMRNLSVRVPDTDGLPVQRVASPTGRVDGRTVRFDSVAPDETAVVRVTVRVTYLRRADLRVTATSDTHLVADTDGATIRGPDVGERTTRTALPAGGDGQSTSDSETGESAGTTGGTTPTQGDGPGPGPILAVGAALAGALLAARR